MTHPREAPSAMAQESTFWELPENGTDHVREWRAGKTKWKGRREDRGQSKNDTVKRICTDFGNFRGRQTLLSRRLLQACKCSISVFSHAMTIMDEEKRVG